MSDTPYNRLITGLQALSSACDGAHALDNVGFNGTDTNFGKSLANQSIDRPLSRKQALMGAKMVQKYRKQCERYGVILPTYDEIKAELETDTDSEVNTPGNIELIDGQIAVGFRYNPDWVTLIKKCGPEKKVEGRWIPSFDRESKQWIFPLEPEYFVKITKAFPAFAVDARIGKAIGDKLEDAEIDIELEDIEYREHLERLGELEGTHGPGNITFFDHQIEGIKTLVEKSRVILADEMGLGKTFTALKAADAYNAPIFVICPASLKQNWLIEAGKLGISIETFSWAKMPEPLESREYVIIADEAHYSQNFRSKRTQRLISLCLDGNCKAAYLLTGTPIKNGRPSNLFPLLVATRHPLGDNKSHFEKRYCNAHSKSIGHRSVWDNTGAAHLDELHEKISPVMLRRLKKDCLDLPAKIRTLRPVDLSKDSYDAYIESFEQMRSEYHDRLEKGEILSGAEALVLINHLRRAGSTAKVQSAFEICDEIVQSGNSIGIGFAFKESAKALQQLLNEVNITSWVLSGDTPQKDRQAMVEAFQDGMIDVAICTFGAGGVGITLTQSSDCLLVDRPWTPGDAVQYEDRFHRIGQDGTVNVQWLQLEGIPYKSEDGKMQDIGVDGWIDTVLLQKQQRIDLVLSGKRKTMRGIPSIESMAQEVLHNLLSDGKKSDYDNIDHQPNVESVGV